MRLTNDQLRAFKRDGYVIVREVLDPELMRQARERFWSGAPSSLRRDDPSTWPGRFSDNNGPLDGPNDHEQSIWRYREPRAEPWMLKLLPACPSVWSIAEQLLGIGQVAPPARTRGIYCTRPERPHFCVPRQAHVDKHPFHLGVVGYIDDTPPGAGGLAVWPASHRLFFERFESRYLFLPTKEYWTRIEEIDMTEPVDCHGRAGDVVFLHHRLAHKAGHNESDRLRLAVLGDFVKKDLRGECALMRPALGRRLVEFAWRAMARGAPFGTFFENISTGRKLFARPGCDLWQDWSEEVREVDDR